MTVESVTWGWRLCLVVSATVSLSCSGVREVAVRSPEGRFVVSTRPAPEAEPRLRGRLELKVKQRSLATRALELYTPRAAGKLPRERALAAAARPPELRWFTVDYGAPKLRARSMLGAQRDVGLEPGSQALGWDAVYEALTEVGEDGFVAATSRDLGGELLSIEPEIALDRPAGQAVSSEEDERGAAVARSAPDAPARVQIGEAPTPVWPNGPAPGWHLGADFSQLAEAREEVRADGPPADGERVVIAHVDTGYAPGHAATPPFLDVGTSANFWEVPEGQLYVTGEAEDRLTGNKESLIKAGFLAQPGHGPGTLSILAGGKVLLGDATEPVELGGAPDARVFEVRVGPTVVHLNSTRLARAIDYAVSKQADVVSLSHGGLPSHLLTDVVNRAYENGTAIFAASSDFFRFPFFVRWLPGVPDQTPSRTMYPASYGRVMSVAGVTAEGRSYAIDPGIIPPNPFKRSQWRDWMLRGSWGPGSVADHTIAAYSPNIWWADYKKKGSTDRLALDGAGTSSATPQVAAAAALWLQRHRKDPELAARWRSWEKAEAVYSALRRSARPPLDGQAQYVGAGVLRAKEALAVPFDRTQLSERPESTVDVAEFAVDVFLSMYLEPGVLPAKNQELLRRSVGLELAQVAALDPRVDRELSDLRAKQGGAVTPSTRALRKALGKSPFVSGFLRLRMAEVED